MGVAGAAAKNPPKGSADAQAWGEKMSRLREEARQKKFAMMRSQMPNATDEDVWQAVEHADKVANATKRAAKAQATQMKLIGQGAIPGMAPIPGVMQPRPVAQPQATGMPTTAPAPVSLHEFQNAAAKESLVGHPVFGSSLRPGARTVDVHRLPSPYPEHNLRGVSPGYLESVSFDDFQLNIVKARHGGGKYLFIARDDRQREIGREEKGISGPAIKTDDDIPDDRARQRAQAAFAGDAASPFSVGVAPPVPAKPEKQEVDPVVQAKLDRLEDILGDVVRVVRDGQQRAAEQAVTPAQAATTDKLEQMMALQRQEFRERMEKEEARWVREQEAERNRWERITQQQQQQQAQMQTILMTTMGSKAPDPLLQTLLTAVIAKDKGGDSVSHLLQAQQGMYSEMMKSVVGLMGDLATQGVGEPKDATDRILGFLTDVGKPVAERLIAAKLTEQSAAPAEVAQPAQTLPPVVFLPDGRMVPPALVGEFATAFKTKHNRPPTPEELHRGLVAAILARQKEDAARAQAQAQAKEQGQPAPQNGKEDRMKQQAAPKPGPWAEKALLTNLNEAFRSGVPAAVFVEKALESGALSEKARIDIGAVYKGAESNESTLMPNLLKLLQVHAIELPLSLLPAMGDPKLKAYLNDVLFVCACDTIEQAKSVIAKDKEAAG